jgi:hypothetical protein
MKTFHTFLPPIAYTTHYDLPHQAISDLELSAIDIPKINGEASWFDYKTDDYFETYTTDLSYLRTTQRWIQTVASDPAYDVLRPEIARTLPSATSSWDHIKSKHRGVFAKCPPPTNNDGSSQSTTLGCNATDFVKEPMTAQKLQKLQMQLTDQAKHLVNQIMVQPTLVFFGLCIGFMFTFSTGFQFPISVLWVALSVLFYKLDPSEFISDQHYCGMVFSKIFAPKHWLFCLFGIGHLLLLIANSVGQCMNIYNGWVYTTDSIQWASDLCRYLVPTANHMSHVLSHQAYVTDSRAHQEFQSRLTVERDSLEIIIAKLERFVWLEKASFFNRVYYSGEIWSQLYQIVNNPVYGKAVNYSFGWNGYIYHLWNIGVCKHMKPATFILDDGSDQPHQDSPGVPLYPTEHDRSSQSMTNDGLPSTNLTLIRQTYPHLYLQKPDTIKSDTSEPTKNTICLDKNIILTGPNASGKTTVLKMTMLNLIFTQQYGYGFYDECIMPYVYQHFCFYLNIPDTNGRDSLFQAEARRCSEIATRASDCTRENVHMFCIFDELFSGTNPEDATEASVAFIRHLTNNHPTTDFMLTTHYIAVCDQFLDSTEEKEAVELLTMEVRTPTVDDTSKNTHYQSTYTVIPGVGRQRGAFGILEQMFGSTIFT